MEDGKVVITYLLRSSVESEKEYLIDKVTSMVELLGGEYVITGKYPAWEYRSQC
jgi:dipeptidase D